MNVMASTTSKNLGKKFEEIIGNGFRAIRDVSVDRIPDQTMHYKDRANVSDFIVYKYPHQYYVECKSIRGNRLPFTKIPQLEALWNKEVMTSGVKAGVICWWIDKDVTRWLPIESLVEKKVSGAKSIAFDEPISGSKYITGRKKKVYFEYNMLSFFR